MALLVVGALATACVAVVFALGGVAGAAALMRAGQGEVVLQLLLSAIFINATLAAVFVGMRVAPAFSEPALRAYPLTRADRVIAQHATSLLEPLWLLVLTLVLALAVGASIVGPSFLGAALTAAILLVGTSYLLARALAGLVAWLLSFSGGSLIVVLGASALLLLPLAPAVFARVAARQGTTSPISGVLSLTPPFAAAAAMALPMTWPVIVALVALGGWAVALTILSARIDRLARFRPAMTGSAAAWEHPCDRLAGLAGARSAPLVGKILRDYLRSGVRYNVVFAVPVVALMARHYDGALLAFALGAAPALGVVATQPLSVNLLGMDGPAVRRYFLLPVSPAHVFRTTALVSLALGAAVCASGLLLWLVFAPAPPTGAAVAMVTAAAAGGLLLFHALGLWTTVLSPRRIPFDIALGNRNVPAANALMVTSWVILFGLPLLLRQVEEQVLLAMWWASPALLGAAAAFYIVTIRSAARVFVTRRERLMERLEESG